jgi:aspartyl protease family protein
MLKTVFVLVALAVAIALAAPEYLSGLAGKSEKTAIAVPAEQPAPAAHGGVVRLPANRSGHYISEIEINNRTVTALVDTGATSVALR